VTKYFLEIKNRLFLLFITCFSTVLIAYFYKETLLFLIVQPNYILSGDLAFFYFIFTDVTEIFAVHMQLITFLSFQIFVIIFIYHTFIFLSPAFFQAEYRYFKTIIKVIGFVWAMSMLLANYVIIPLTWNFFLSFQELITNQSFNIHFEAKLSEYFNFYISLYYLCGFYFQVFVLLFLFLNYTKTNLNNIKRFRKLYYFSFVVFSTLISPPEILSQILISLFFISFYETLLFIFLFKSFTNTLVR
jgi:sec-independent protein translocase protein TatC